MPLPLMALTTEIPQEIAPSQVEILDVVNAVLTPVVAKTVNDTAVVALNSFGATLESSLMQLANLSSNAKDSVRLAATRDILDIHGVQFKKDTAIDSHPVFNFTIQTENGNVQLNQMFQR